MNGPEFGLPDLSQEREPRPPRPGRMARAAGPVRAGMFAPCLNRGGAESVQLAQARATAGRIRWEGCAVWGREEDANPGMVAETRALMPVAFGLDAAVDLASRVDVVVSWIAMPHRPIIDRAARPPKVIWVDHFPHRETYGRVLQDCLVGVDWIVGVSELCSPGFPAAFGGRTSIIGNAIDPARLVPGRPAAEVKAGWRIGPGNPVAGFFSRLDHRRRPDGMVRMAPHLPRDWHVVIMGEAAPYPRQYVKLVRMMTQLDPEVAGRVHILPPAGGVGETLRAYDVLVVLSGPEHESFGLTMAEGIALGRPVVATASGLELMYPGVARRVPVDPPGEVLAAAVLAAHREGPKPGASEFVRERAGIERFGRSWARLIEQVAGLGDRDEPADVGGRPDRPGQGPGPCGAGPGPRGGDPSGAAPRVDRDVRAAESPSP